MLISRMAALVSIPVSLWEVLQVRSPDGLSAHETRAITAQTVRHLLTLLQNIGTVDGVPLLHVTAASIQLTGAGQVRLGHADLCPTNSVYTVAPEHIQALLQSLGSVMLSAGGRSTFSDAAPDPLVGLLTSLGRSHMTLQQITKTLEEMEGAADSPRYQRTVALLHEELLGLNTPPVHSPQQSAQQPNQLDLTAHPSMTEAPGCSAPAAAAACLEDSLLPEDSPSVSHGGSFPEVPLSHTHTHRTCERSATPMDHTDCNKSSAPEYVDGVREDDRSAASIYSNKSELAERTSAEHGKEENQTSRMLAGNLSLSLGCLPLGYAGGSIGASIGGASSGDGYRHRLVLERDMVRLMNRQGSAGNLATSTPNQSPLAPALTVDGTFGLHMTRHENLTPPANEGRTSAPPSESPAVQAVAAAFGRTASAAAPSAQSHNAAPVGNAAAIAAPPVSGEILPATAATSVAWAGEQQQQRCRRAVRRRASALYAARAAVDDPTAPHAFYGPEFIIRARELPRRLQLPTGRGAGGGSGAAGAVDSDAPTATTPVLVVLLTGQKLEISCHLLTHTIADVTRAVLEEYPYPNPSLLGLAIQCEGQYLFPPPTTRLFKALVSPQPGRATLYQRFKLYPGSETLARPWPGLHLLYLQLRQNMLENQLDVSSAQVVQLSALALLAEFGHRHAQHAQVQIPDQDGSLEDVYFLPEHYVPEPLTSQPELLRQLTAGHLDSGGSGGAAAHDAERSFVRLAAACRGYGRHRCAVDLRVRSYSTSQLSLDRSCLRLSRCDAGGRSTARCLHWSSVAKVQYRRRGARRLVISCVGADSITLCGEKLKLRCLEYMIHQHLGAYRDAQCTDEPARQVYRPTAEVQLQLREVSSSHHPSHKRDAQKEASSPKLTRYCVRTPLSSLANRTGRRAIAPIDQSLLAANQKPNLRPLTGRIVPVELAANENTPPPLWPTNGSAAGGPLRTRGRLRSAGRFRSVTQLTARVGRATAVREQPGRALGGGEQSSPPPAPGIRMGTRIAVSALQRQKLRSREALPMPAGRDGDGGGPPHLSPVSGQAYVIAAEIPPTPESALPPGVLPLRQDPGTDLPSGGACLTHGRTVQQVQAPNSGGEAAGKDSCAASNTEVSSGYTAGKTIGVNTDIASADSRIAGWGCSAMSAVSTTTVSDGGRCLSQKSVNDLVITRLQRKLSEPTL